MSEKENKRLYKHFVDTGQKEKAEVMLMTHPYLKEEKKEKTKKSK